MNDGPGPRSLSDWGLEPAVDHIERVQRADGLILWYPDGPADPWDHVESAMALSIAGRNEAARRAYRWVADAQHDDGALWATYGDSEDDDGAHDGDEPRKETHRSAYVAVGAWHHYCCTEDRDFLENLWPTVRDALAFACDHQAPTGEIYWTVDPDGEVYEDALIAGCASIYKSLACGAAIADALGRTEARDRWLEARADLGAAIRTRPDRFDRTWESKSRYAMDWFYPVLCGVVIGDSARDRLDAGADRFLEEELGCRCVADEPWVTVAESCELVLSLAAVGRTERAREILEWLFQWTDDEGIFWTGYQFEDEAFWPGERPTWTGAAAVLAADALSGLSGAADLFTDPRPE
ncbi:prenyltransferase [Haloterrigena sp. SYSU A558-1]|uniref:Prenyltransferase n=1 Tax=Haloterrigena gelatinilytica TaxID=2741724 RepID=A0ABX2LFZ2_9EURY|nr:prenyltransferase [Haloterrigena gelatinilytica]NUC73278.1 prenyltransferase [Haloterrigena gelatinilytica]